MWDANFQDELYHHDIKGQRWGVRRFQNEDGSLTSKGKTRYSNTTRNKSSYIPLDGPEMKAGVKGHRNKLIEKYKAEGMSQKEAEAAADKRIATEKKVAIGATAAAAVAIAAGFAYKNYQDRYIESFEKIVGNDEAELKLLSNIAKKNNASIVNKVKKVAEAKPDDLNIKNLAEKGEFYLQDRELDLSNTPLHRITKNANFEESVKKPFYAAYDAGDRLKYRGLYSKQLMQQGAKHIYDIEIQAKGPLKVAGQDTAASICSKLMKTDKDFWNNTTSEIDNVADNFFLRFVAPERAAAADAAKAVIGKYKFGDTIAEKDAKIIYKTLNAGMAGGGNYIGQSLYNELKKSGYQAIQDVNDILYSGYKNKDPLIVFDPNSVVANVNGRELSIEEMTRDLNTAAKGLGLIMR